MHTIDELVESESCVRVYHSISPNNYAIVKLKAFGLAFDVHAKVLINNNFFSKKEINRKHCVSIDWLGAKFDSVEYLGKDEDWVLILYD
jgi:hypothetical protein